MSEASGRGAPDPRTLLRLDRQGSSALPLHEQVYRQLRARIESGALPGGSRLPAARVVAAELGVARNTVDAALLRLQQDGLIVRRAGAGSVVADGVAIVATTPLTRFVRVHRSGRDTLKVYVIAAQAAFPGDDLVTAALQAVLASPRHPRHDDSGPLSGTADARAAEPARIGSLVVQLRQDTILAMLGLWQDDGLLHLRVWTGAAWQGSLERASGSVLTSEALVVFMHESVAWQRYAVSVRDGEADAAWLADVLHE